MDTSFLGFAVLLFIATVLMIEGVYLFWHSRHGAAVKRVKARVRAAAPGAGGDGDQVSILKRRTLSDSALLVSLLSAVPHVHALDQLLLQAGLRWTVARFIGYSAAFGACGMVVPFMLHQ